MPFPRPIQSGPEMKRSDLSSVLNGGCTCADSRYGCLGPLFIGEFGLITLSPPDFIFHIYRDFTLPDPTRVSLFECPCIESSHCSPIGPFRVLPVLSFRLAQSAGAGELKSDLNRQDAKSAKTTQSLF